MKTSKFFFFLICSAWILFTYTGIYAGVVSVIHPELPAKPALKVLFIGNSYTYVNNLPQMFTELSASGGWTVTADQSTFGGYTLEQHSTDTATLDKISADNWDYIILQEQSQFPTIEYYRDNSMYPAARVLDSLIKTQDSETVFFMTWGRKYGGQQTIGAYSSPVFADFYEMQNSLRYAYMQIAVELSARVSPVGRAWGLALTLDPSVDLWAADNSHPTLKGTYLAACVFYVTLFHESPVGLPYTGGLTTTDAAFYQNVAYRICTTIEASHVKDTLFLYPVKE
ncbi:MAG: hypothetical protein A2161_08600 [Candidatus Schekmanbacteria bacterium RBG_13_48_7]|uniref:DUF4886 domain-containing protein n=1 Tax=Candidatus Schekmanbacteria bacterium RBG_13_48_7 TaxID=1817878 RepID=A0A1F7RX94_9BACT|nr:MAG: hypothetical protein A2161_08600 [Candidatus Schekmanbacteria bacterium RBG_13_48_7]